MNARKALIEAYKAAVIAIAKRATLKDVRHEVSAAERAAGTGAVYAAGTKTKADFVAYCEARAAELIEQDHYEALEMAREMQTEADRKAGRPVDEEGNDMREYCGNDIEAAHAEALEINAVIDDAVSRCKPFCDNKNLDHASIINAIDVVRQRLPKMGYNARFTVEMMIAARRLAKLARQKAAENYRAMMERCAKDGYGCNEIPF